jgi:hypothetical protein
MPQHMRFDDQDKRAFAALDADFAISDEVATISGQMEVEVVRLDDARLQLTITFPGGETLDVRIRRTQLLQQLDVEADEG